MFLKLNHKKLESYKCANDLVIECYKLTEAFPSSEKFGLITQIRRAAISVLLNISEGCSRRSSEERKRFFEISRGSVIEIDAACGIANQLGYMNGSLSEKLAENINKSFALLTKLMQSQPPTPTG